MKKRTNDPHTTTWRQIFGRTQRAMAPFGQDDDAGGDYWVPNLVPIDRAQVVELHNLHLLRPEVMKALYAVIKDFPGWRMEISVVCPEKGIYLDAGSGLIIDSNGILDLLARDWLPEQYRFVYENSRPPPPGFVLPDPVDRRSER
jgi:hypothetical protein